MADDTLIDRSTYAPFLFMETDGFCSLLLFDDQMPQKAHVFEEREGWIGNGYDWNSIAEVILAERLPDLGGQLSRNPSAGTFSISGERPALEPLGAEMAKAFHNEELLRDLLSRAQLD